MGGTVLVLVSAYCRVVTFCRRFDEAVERFVGGFAVEATSIDEKRRLTIHRYHVSRVSRGTDLFEWEREWYEQRLPPPPARVLVGGCGAGREMAWLLERHYGVDGFDPVPSMVSEAHTRLGNDVRVLRLSYEDLVQSVAGSAGDGPASPLTQHAYDAVILGWTSLTHVFDAAVRTDLLTALNRLCPGGPILCSYWEADGSTAAGRGERLGRRVGRTIQRARHLPAASPAIVFRPHAGFGYEFEKAELAELAASAGRVAICENRGWFPHATLVRPSA